MREFFLANFAPTSFVSLPFDVFPDAYIDCVVFTAERTRERAPVPTDVRLIVFPHRHKIKDTSEFSERETIGNTASWLAMREREFLVTLGTAAESILQKVTAQPRKVGEFVDLKRGIETYTLHDSKAGLQRARRAFDGVLQRYVCEHSAPKYFDYTDEIERSKPWKFFSGPRLLLRQVLSRKLRLQATYVEEAFLSNQSVQSILPTTGIEWTWLLSVLNSKLMSWFFVKFNAAARRDDFPKIIIKADAGTSHSRAHQ